MSPAYRLIRTQRIVSYAMYRFNHATSLSDTIRYGDAMVRAQSLLERLINRYHESAREES